MTSASPSLPSPAIAAPDPSPPSSSWRGRLELHLGRQGDRAIVRRQHTVAPLKFQRPFYPEGPDLCHGAMLHTGGGIVGGDRLAIDIQLDRDTQALLTTVAAAKLYRSAGPVATQTVRLTLGEQACLEWLPQDTIAFEGCNVEQTTRVDLAPGARWLGWDVLRFGRTARGEQFMAGRWRSRLEVWQHGNPLWVDLQTLNGSDANWHSPNHLNGCPVVGSFALLGHPCDRNLIERLRQLPPPAAPGSEWGVTRLSAGLLARYRGPSALEARRWFQSLWQYLRPHYLQRSPAPVRLWT